MRRGKYIVIEGTDGTGKSTQVQLLQDKLANLGISSTELHEPGGTPIANELRTIIKNGSLAREAKTNLLLFTAARHESWKHAQEALAKGAWVISERNYFSSLAYQGYAEGLDTELILQITKQFTDELYITPDVALILALEDEAERTKRLNKRGALTEAPDAFESRDTVFQQAVKEGYRSIAKRFKLPVISASQSREAIAEEIYSFIKPQLER